ncbi:MAG: hypothetical protein JWQ18_425 [Conexibacter sp.]|nr:hypothetical protein [Conexibacter sp.]
MATFPRPLLRMLLCGLVLSMLSLGCVTQSQAQTTRTAVVSDSAAVFLEGKLDELTRQSSATDPLYESDGRWHLGDDSCKRCVLGGAVAAATIATRFPERGTHFRDLARQTVDRFIATQLPSGSFPNAVDPSKSDGIETEFAGVQIGTVAHLLDGQVSAATSARWARSLRAAAHYLIDADMTTYYVNGNINLGTTLTLGLAAQATGDADLQQAFERSWDFTLHPPERWKAYGLRFTKAPKRADWADGAGYLVEAGATPGFDAHYTQLQSSLATRMWLMLGDARALRLANVLTNTLLKRVDDSWNLDTSDGSRHPGSDLSFPFVTASLAAAGDCRPALRGAGGQFDHVESWFDRNLDPASLGDNATWLFYLGNDVATFAMLDAHPACSQAQAATVPRAKRR